MSNKQDLQKALDKLAEAKKEDIKAVSKAIESIHQVRQEQTETQSRQD
ncbi:unnamed protein product [marine sediment metagenome]|uniref:Uncharacterized protein n=1 Tax=marine sediment metagenome TaxID=412755 RepID=X1KRU9_9ZZZZ